MAEEKDWDAIELDYRAGVLPPSAVAKKHGISTSQLKRQVDKYLWERKPLDPLALQQAHGVASLPPSPPKFAMDSNLDEKSVATMAVVTAARVIDIHRTDVRKLREITGKFTEVLAGLFDHFERLPPKDLIEALQVRTAMMGALIGDDTPADLLEKLSRVMTRLVTIERQAYGLDVMPLPDPNAEPAAQAVATQVNELWKQVQDLQIKKALPN